MSDNFNIDTKFPEAVYIEEGVQQALKEFVSGDLSIKVIDTNSVIAYDDVTTAGSTYLQYADGTIKKWGANNIRYSAPNGTLWADRATATYTAETV